MASGAATVVRRSSFPVLTSVRVAVSTRKKIEARKKCSAGRGWAGVVTEEAIGGVFSITPGKRRKIARARKNKEKRLVQRQGGASHLAGEIGNGHRGQVSQGKRF